MSIKMEESVLKDLEKFKKEIDRKDGAWMLQNQELILTTLRILLDSNFQKEIRKLREKYKPPKKWFEDGSVGEDYMDWVEEKNPTPPYFNESEEIVEICNMMSIEPTRYGDFIVDYLFSGSISLTLPFKFVNVIAKNEYMYRSRIELDYGEGLVDRSLKYTAEPQRGYIRFYGDTTASKLINFIRENKEEIDTIRKYINPYPHRHKFEYFKRDVSIYLLYRMGKKTSEIASIIYRENLHKDSKNLKEMEKIYAVDDSNIRRIVKIMASRIKSVSKT